MRPTLEPIQRFRQPGDFSPFPVASRAGPWVFAPCVVNLSAGESRPLEAWRPRHEARAVLLRLGEVMELAGGSLDQVVNLLQCFDGRGQTGGYVEERRGYFPAGVPTSTGTAGTRLATPGALIQLDAVGVLPTSGESFAYIGGTSKNASYSNALSYRDIVFFSGVMTNAPETQPDPQLWFGSAVKSEFRFIMKQKLAQVLADAGCSVDDIAVAHIHLLDPVADLGPLADMIDECFPERKPVFMVSPSSGLGAMPGRVEITPVAVRPGGTTLVESIAGSKLPVGMLGGPPAQRVGDLVYVGTLTAVDRVGRREPARDPRLSHLVDAAAQDMSTIVDQLEAIAGASGTTLDRLMRVRLYASDLAHARGALQVFRQRVGDDVPVSIIEDAEAAGWLGEGTVSADAVFHAPR